MKFEAGTRVLVDDLNGGYRRGIVVDSNSAPSTVMSVVRMLDSGHPAWFLNERLTLDHIPWNSSLMKVLRDE